MALTIKQSTKAYEKWLTTQLRRGRGRRSEIVKDDLCKKHEKMAETPFVFLRATYWRWAETIHEICPKLQDAPKVSAVGDIHLENFGVWRDTDGRLVWGVNDFDEAAEMPYVLDLLRLAVSACLARGSRRIGAETICSSILDGYREGLKTPGAFVLDRDHPWLRDQFEVDQDQRDEFWDDIDKAGKRAVVGVATPHRRYRVALNDAMPEPDITLRYWPRSAGTGSLGRPRWVACGDCRGTPVIREAKAVVPSAWSLLPGRGKGKVRCSEIASGRFRSPDPWYAKSDKTVVRRLSPNSRKLEIKDDAPALLDPMMLRFMGHELANVHLGTVRRHKTLSERILVDLRLRRRTFFPAVRQVIAFITKEHREWRGAHAEHRKSRKKR